MSIIDLLVKRCNMRLQTNYLAKAKMQRWTGWEDADLNQVKHMKIDDEQMLAVMEVVAEFIEELRDDLSSLERKAVVHSDRW